MTGHTSHHLEEITTRIAECITRFGVAGEVQVDQQSARLVGHGPPAEVPLGDLLERWGELNQEDRARRCLDTARKLVSIRRSSLPPSQPPRFQQLPGWIVPLLAFVVLGAVGWWWLRRPAGPKPEPERAAASASDRVAELDRDVRAEQVCQRTRSRVMRGATVGPLDVEGWVVELVLQRAGTRRLGQAGVMAEFIEANKPRPRVIWPQAPALSALTGPETRVVVQESDLAAAGIQPRRSLVLTFQGTYINPYFERKQRIQYLMLANALAQRLGATHGALYARCKGGTNHHIGTWFLGPSPNEALGSLIYFMGTYADSPHVSSAVLGDAAVLDRAQLFEGIRLASARAPRSEIGRWLGAQGGMIAGPAEGPSRVTFPFKDANRASRASREIARLLEIGSH